MYIHKRHITPSGIARPHDTIYSHETVSCDILGSDGKPTGKTFEKIVVVSHTPDSLIIDQSINAEDLSLRSQIANGISLSEITNFNIGSDSPLTDMNEINSLISAHKNRFTAPVEPPVEPSNN